MLFLTIAEGKSFVEPWPSGRIVASCRIRSWWTVILILENGAQPGFEDEPSHTPLSRAALAGRNGHLKSATVNLLKSCSNVTSYLPRWWYVNTPWQVEVMLAVGYHDDIVVRCVKTPAHCYDVACLFTCHPCVRETILSLDFSQHCCFMTVPRNWLCRCLLVCLPSYLHPGVKYTVF